MGKARLSAVQSCDEKLIVSQCWPAKKKMEMAWTKAE